MYSDRACCTVRLLTNMKLLKLIEAKLTHSVALTNQFVKTLLSHDSPKVDLAYQDFCNIISLATKRSIPRGCRNNHMPCWDAECESKYRVFLRSLDVNNFSRAATALLTKLNRKLWDRWPEAVQSINFSRFSRKAWSILNNLSGRSRHSPRHCPVSATPSHLS